MSVTITVFRDHQAASKSLQTHSLEELAALIRSMQRTSKQELPWLKCAVFGETRSAHNSLRHDDNVIEVTGCEGDYDRGEMDFDEAIERMTAAGVEAIVYTSPSHDPSKPRWRVLAPFSRPLPPDERARMVARLNGIFDGALADESFTLSQSYYYGHLYECAEFRAEITPGIRIDLLGGLDQGAVGRANRIRTGNGEDLGGEYLDIARAFELVSSGESFHPQVMSILASYAARGVPRDALVLMARSLVAAHPRYQGRLPEVLRMIEWVYAREAQKLKPPTPSTITPQPWQWISPETMKPRPWLLGTMLMRGHTTVLGSTGGIGKTSYAIACALAVITGRRDITGQFPFLRGNVWYITLEDDRDEISRRFLAAMLLHRVGPDDIENRLFINDASSQPLVLAGQDIKGNFVANPDAEKIKSGIAANAILLTIIDPLIKAHRTTENLNEHRDRLITLINDIARETTSSILIPCHTRKSTADNGSQDSFRGGSAFVDGARIARTLTAMTNEDAALFGVTADVWRYFSITDAKANLAPRQDRAWVKITSIQLGNTAVDPNYPAGDSVQAATPWIPPSAFAGLEGGAFAQTFNQIDAGPGDGWFYAPDKNGKFWVGDLIIQNHGKTPEQAKLIIAAWRKNGVLKTERYKSPNRNDADRVITDRNKIAEMIRPNQQIWQDDES